MENLISSSIRIRKKAGVDYRHPNGLIFQFNVDQDRIIEYVCGYIV